MQQHFAHLPGNHTAYQVDNSKNYHVKYKDLAAMVYFGERNKVAVYAYADEDEDINEEAMHFIDMVTALCQHHDIPVNDITPVGRDEI